MNGELEKTVQPFRFSDRVHLPELTGLKATNIYELLAHIKTVPGSVIYYHTHHFLQQHQYLTPEPPNDFAYWVTETLNEVALGEQLASINASEFSSIRSLREKIVSVIENYLSRCKRRINDAPEGMELYFIKSVSFIFPTPYVASNLKEFADYLKRVSVNSIYFHMFEAKLRLEKGVNDFSNWFESIGESELAKKIARLDPYTHTMEGLRKKILRLISERTAKTNANKES